MSTEPVHIGDGLYASYDGWHVKLSTRRQHGEHIVYLDRPTLIAFIKWGSQNGVFQMPKESLL